MDDVAAVLSRLGCGSLLAKSDIKHAYRQIPVHLQDRPLLGMRWQGNWYIDATLPFGLRSAPIIFLAVADALEWVVKSRGAGHVFYYVDDFIFVGPPQSPDCHHDLQIFSQSCAMLGVIIADEKTKGPATCVTVLGIEVDSRAMELRLPEEKTTAGKRATALMAGKKARSPPGLGVFGRDFTTRCKGRPAWPHFPTTSI